MKTHRVVAEDAEINRMLISGSQGATPATLVFDFRMRGLVFGRTIVHRCRISFDSIVAVPLKVDEHEESLLNIGVSRSVCLSGPRLLQGTTMNRNAAKKVPTFVASQWFLLIARPNLSCLA